MRNLYRERPFLFGGETRRSPLPPLPPPPPSILPLNFSFLLPLLLYYFILYTHTHSLTFRFSHSFSPSFLSFFLFPSFDPFSRSFVYHFPFSLFSYLFRLIYSKHFIQYNTNNKFKFPHYLLSIISLNDLLSISLFLF